MFQRWFYTLHIILATAATFFLWLLRWCYTDPHQDFYFKFTWLFLYTNSKWECDCCIGLSVYLWKKFLVYWDLMPDTVWASMSMGLAQTPSHNLLFRSVNSSESPWLVTFPSSIQAVLQTDQEEGTGQPWEELTAKSYTTLSWMAQYVTFT